MQTTVQYADFSGNLSFCLTRYMRSQAITHACHVVSFVICTKISPFCNLLHVVASNISGQHSLHMDLSADILAGV